MNATRQIHLLRGATASSLVALLIGLAGCRREAAQPPAPPPPTVVVGLPIPYRVQSFREYTGYLEAVETVNVRPRLRGYLKSVAFKEGTHVRKGDLLYEIDPREYEAALARSQADRAKAAAELTRAQAEEDRSRSLVRTAAISEEEFQQRVAARKSAEATVALAESAIRLAQLDVEFTRITAPIEGRIGRTQVTEGNLVGGTDATVLTTIVRLDPIYVTFDAPEQRVIEYGRRALSQKLPNATDATIPIAIGVAAENGHPHPGVIDFRENRVDPGTGTVRLRGRLDNPDNLLLPGLFARVRIPLGDPQERLLVPEVALLTDQRGRFLYVVTPENTVEAKVVSVGPRVGTYKAIEQGLQPTDRVVVSGVQKVRPKATVNPEATVLPPPKAESPTSKGNRS